MTRELKDQRITVMMSKSEVAALDEWGWSNRIRARGEVIRTLVERGLFSSKAATDPSYDTDAVAAQRQWDAAVKEAAEAIAPKRHGEDLVPIHPLRVVR